MAYISKNNILAAYKKLSQMHPDPNAQGATQKISAIRHFLALDSFYKLHNRDCNTRDKDDKEEFADLVGKVCEVCHDLYTTNFYYPLKHHTGDYSVGSNFYSAGQVNASLVNPNEIFDYPKRGGIPLMNVQNGVLERNISLYHNFSNYITSTDYAVALVIWLIRKTSIELNNGKTLYDNIYLALSKIFTLELLNVLFKDSAAFEQELNKYNLIFGENFYSIQENDIENLFDVSSDEEKHPDFPISYQVIFYGAPGTGKSHRIKKQLEGVSKENIFRTTFHPDSDYSTFVGAYKPTKAKKPLYGLNGGLTVRLNDGKDDLDEDIITYKFIPQAFLNAYMQAYRKPDEYIYLIIEEINRGNCAQIFGDLFQLLDRDENGKSEYTIKADADLKAYLEEELGEGGEGIKDGELCLPSNLYIYATMNTSDQSLFPIDSAFKRRWDWEYEPIKYKNTDWEIEIGDLKYRWSDFQKEVNTRGSEDKMLGDYFVNPPTRVISYNLFRNKILFYLWNDVCKDGDADIFPTNEEFSFSKLYDEDSKQLIISIMDKLELKPIPINGDNTEDEEGDDLLEGEDNNSSSIRYSINGEETDEKGKIWGKGALVKRAVEIFCQNNPDLSAEEVRDRWISVGFKIPHVVETEDDKQKRLNGSTDKTGRERCKPIKLRNEEVVYVSTEVGNDKVYNNFEDFLSKIKSRPEWGINIQEL